jgi:hypothetical protein
LIGRAQFIRADHPWLTTNQFLDKLDANLQRAMSMPLPISSYPAPARRRI